MLAHDNGIMVRLCFQSLAQRRLSLLGQLATQGIAQRHRDIAQPAFVPDAANGAAGHAFVELRLGPGEQLDQRDVVEVMANLEVGLAGKLRVLDRKSTRLNSSHQIISYAVFCLKKKNKGSVNYCRWT